MKSRGRRKKRSPRRARLAAARRAAAALAVGNLPLHVLIDEGMLSPSTAPQMTRVRASDVERAHVERLRANPEDWRHG
jgi:hypothetical protein